MIDNSKPIKGIVCFGSALIRVDPDFASLTFEIGVVNKNPQNAFSKAKEISKQLNKVLQSWEKVESRSSNLRLSEEKEHSSGAWRRIGYRASIQTNVVIRDLSKVEEIISAAIDVGAHNINSFSFGTSSLKDYRAHARRNAIEAAIEKAENYCIAANVELGKVIGIEDVNPERTNSYGESHLANQSDGGIVEDATAIDPGAISVHGAVRETFELHSRPHR